MPAGGRPTVEPASFWRAAVDEEEVRQALSTMRRRALALVKDIDALDDKLSGKVAEQAELMSVDSDVTFDSILLGRFDSAPKKRQRSRAITKVLLVQWCEEWGKDHRRVKLTDDRHRAYLAALDDGWTPSQFAKAMVGMRVDPWRDRPKHNGWKLVRRGMQKFLDLYEEMQAGTTHKLDLSALGETRSIRGVLVPSGYAWDHHDDFNKDIGNRFDPRSCRWVAPEDPTFGELEPYNTLQE
jgi:hypothetical protein